MRFTGVVLSGGRSSRMGRDKALIEIEGRSLAAIAAHALRDAGAATVTVVGGDEAAMRDLGLEVQPDDHPGEGPLGAIVTALGSAPEGIVMVLACDMPAIDAATVSKVVAALHDHPDAEVAAPRLDGRLQILTAAYRTRLAPRLEAAFASGERAPRRALEGVAMIVVDGLDPERLRDVDRPEDLHRYDPLPDLRLDPDAPEPYAQPHTRAGGPAASPPGRPAERGPL